MDNFRRRSMAANEDLLGVFIYTTDDSLIKSTEWATSGKTLSDVVGIAVLTEDHKFVIAPGNLSTRKVYNDATKACSGLSAIAKQDLAEQRFAGMNDTNVMVKSTNYGTSTSYAAGACKAYTKGGESWYLPSLGELKVAYDNKADVDDALAMCGATPMDVSKVHWTSTYCGGGTGSICFWTLNWNTGNMAKYHLSNLVYVRPFCAF